MHEQILHRITNPRALGLCVHTDSCSFLEISISINVSMADAGKMLDYWHCRTFGDCSNQLFSPTGNDDIDKSFLSQECRDCLSIGRANELDRGLRQAHLNRSRG